MRKMKYLLIALFAVLQFTACDSDDDLVVKTGDLPTAAQTFLNQYFPDMKIVQVKLDAEKMGRHYDVKLADGSELEFDENGNWTEVDCKTRAVPSAIVPTPIANYVVSNYNAGVFIVKIEREISGYEIELSNGLDIKFNNEFNVIKVEN